MRIAAILAPLSLGLGFAGDASAQAADSATQSGEALFSEHCASCHANPDARTPSVDQIRKRPASAILNALSNGAMRVQGSRLNGIERRQLAVFLGGDTLSADPTGAATGRCKSNPPLDANAPSWNDWGAGVRNERFQSAQAAGLRSSNLPSLKLKWAFGFPDATSAWATPTVAGGRVFVGSQNGMVYGLDVRSGCIYWYFSANGGVRTAATVATIGGRTAVLFGDTGANAYALDAHSGELLWKTKVERHAMARITGSLVVHGDRVFVPMSSYEEAQMRAPDYECCTFRGSVTALDLKSGKIDWQSYVIPETPKAHEKKPNGVSLFGPSGSAIWSAPTIDVKRNALYVATGNGYTGPPHASSDGIVAMDLSTGKIKWYSQLHENDVYIGSCWTEYDEQKPECKNQRGPDYDIGNAPILATLADGTDRLIVGQKSGIGWALDPDQQGKVVWQYRAGQGGALGGMEWGSAVDAKHAYFPVSDISSSTPGGLHAVDLKTGERVWAAPPATPKCASPGRCNAAQAAAITVIDGAVLSGANDGMLRAYSTADGHILWEVSTDQEYQTINAVPATGSSILGPGPIVAGGMVFVSSGYGAFGGRPGNVLLAYGLDK